ncbi:MAG TPA: BTAD domain-containing putative transcriptional regulator [Longimicrobium sp.]|nr:BTAD domain-containing putative transcriptional regulator [Longimicrobium sp.]
MLRIHVLGGITICRGGVPLTGAAAQPRRLAVLGLLARAGTRSTTRDRVIDLVWPDAPGEQGRRALTQALCALRRELGAEDVFLGVHDLRLNPERVCVDLWEFERALAEDDPGRAVECYAGPFLDGFRLAGAGELERWCEGERDALARRHEEALATLARRAQEAGDLEAAVAWWRRRAACDPLEARVAVHLMNALAAAGDRAAAVQHGRIHQSLVEDQLGIPPDPAVRELMQRLQEAPPPPPPSPAPLPVAPRPEPGDPPASVADVPAAAAVGPVPSRRVRRHRVRTASAGILVLLAALLAFAGTWMVRARPAVEAPVLVVGSIRQHGAGSDSALAAIVPDLLATGLGRTGAVQVISPGRVYALAGQDDRRAPDLELAAAAGATQLIDGSLYRTARGLRLDLRRVEVSSGRQLEALTLEGEDVFALVDQGTDRLLAGLGVAAPSSDVASVTTGSAVAYRFYAEGVRSYYHGDRRTAVRMLDAALAEDSGFAMAEYYRALSDLESPAVSLQRMARARRLASRATDRERLLIRAGWAARVRSPELRALAETLAVRYPHEVEGHYLTGLAYVQRAAYADAVAPLERAIALDSLGLRGVSPVCRGCDALQLLANTYLIADSGAAAERVARRWLAAQPRAPDPYVLLTAVLEARGRPEEALAAYGAAVARGELDEPEWSYRAQHLVRKGDHRTADELLRAQLASASRVGQVEALWYLTISLRQQGRLHDALAAIRRMRALHDRLYAPWEAFGVMRHEGQVLLEMGDARGALARFDSAARLRPPDPFADTPPPVWVRVQMAGACARLGDTAAVARLADEVEAAGARSAWAADQRAHHYVRGLLWLARGDDRQAAAAFRRALESRTFGYTRINVELARVLLRQGRAREAAELLEAALRGSLEANNLYVTRTELHELLARAWTAAGEPGRAMPHLRAVDAAWSAADPPYAARRARLVAELRPLARPLAGRGGGRP